MHQARVREEHGTVVDGKVVGTDFQTAREWVMPREARLFDSSSGSVSRGFLKFRANIPPRWIQNARASRKRVEPEVVRAFGILKRLRKTSPKARVSIRNAAKDLRAVLRRWETAYNKESFYRGLRVLLELQRNGVSKI